MKHQMSKSSRRPSVAYLTGCHNRFGNHPVRSSTPTLWVTRGRKITKNLKGLSDLPSPQRPDDPDGYGIAAPASPAAGCVLPLARLPPHLSRPLYIRNLAHHSKFGPCRS